MTTLVTRADLDDVRGSAYVDELLRVAFESSDTPAEKIAKADARLAVALAEGDAFIRRYVDAPLDWPAYPVQDLANIRPHAREHVWWFLKKNSQAGASKADNDAHDTLSKEMHFFRERKMWSGSTVFQEPTQSEVVASASAFSTTRLGGLV